MVEEKKASEAVIPDCPWMTVKFPVAGKPEYRFSDDITPRNINALRGTMPGATRLHYHEVRLKKGDAVKAAKIKAQKQREAAEAKDKEREAKERETLRKRAERAKATAGKKEVKVSTPKAKSKTKGK